MSGSDQTDSGNSECQWGNLLRVEVVGNGLQVTVGISRSDEEAIIWELLTFSDITHHSSDDELGLGVSRERMVNVGIYHDDQIEKNVGRGLIVESEAEVNEDQDARVYDTRTESEPIGVKRDGGALNL